MVNNLLPFTYKIPLKLERKDLTLKAGLCFSQARFAELSAKRCDFLHSKEETYFSRLTYLKRQYSYLLGRYCAKQAIAAYIPLNNLTDIWIDTGIFHQPIVNVKDHTNIQVSISHTDTLGTALAFPEAHPMAIDIETICPSKVETIKTQLSLSEQKLAFLLSDTEVAQVTSLWTVKEALSKVLKCGFMIPFDLLEVEAIKPEENFMLSYFKNFKQYKALTFFLDTLVCSLVYPQKTYLELDITDLQKTLGRIPS